MSNSSRQSLSSRIGPYSLERVLGEGGGGIVYLANRGSSGEKAALKTVHAADPDRIGLLRREIRAVSRLDHPDVVHVIEDGVHEGRPWYSMTYLEAPTLGEWLEALWSHQPSPWSRPEPPGAATTLQTLEKSVPFSSHRSATHPLSESFRDEGSGVMPSSQGTSIRATERLQRAAAGQLQAALTVVAALCRPLAFVHGEGLVHRDLKPSNVFLPNPRRAIVADFGLATPFEGAAGRESVETDTRLRGTVSYMAPEQIHGQGVDARADLYSVGCILYELITGEPPFTGDVQRVLTAHLRVPPILPSARAEGVPVELDDLVMRLLAKDPARRVSYAEDVVRLLEQLGADPAEPRALPEPRPYLYRPRFVGRKSELVALESALEDAASRCAPRVLLISGESGIGKSRIVAELGARARQRGYSVVAGESRVNMGAAGKADSPSGMADAPLAPLRGFLQHVADRCHAEGAEFTAQMLGDRAPLLFPLEPSFQQLPGAERLPELPVLPPDLAERRFFAFLGDLLAAMSQETPQVLLLDDLQWADDLTLAFLEYLRSPAAPAMPLLVLGTFRSEETRPRLEQLARSGDVIAMQRLDEAEVRSVVSDMLGLDTPPAELAEFLARQSEGNPFFAGEYLRTAVSCRVLERGSGGAWRVAHTASAPTAGRTWSLPLPGALNKLLGLRLKDLPADARRLLTAAAVLGRTFELEVCRRIAELSEAQAFEAERELSARQIIAGAAHGALRFDHDKIREVIYTELAPEDRLRLHRAAAEALEPGADPAGPARAEQHRASGGDAERYATLGHHWAAADFPERAAEHLCRAGDAARGVPAMREAARYYWRAIDQLQLLTTSGQDVEANFARVFERLADVLERDGQHAAAREAYATAAFHLPLDAYVDRARLLRKEGLTWEVVHAHAEALEVLDRAERALELETGDRRGAWETEWLELEVRRAVVLYFQDEITKMNDVIASIEPVVLERGDAKQRALLFHLASNAKNRGNRFIPSAEVVTLAQKAVNAVELCDDFLEKVALRFDLGFALLWHGSLPEAAETLRASLQMARATGDLLLISRCLTYLGVAYRRQRNESALAPIAEEALRVANAGGFADYSACARAELGWLSLRRNDRARAETEIRAAVTRWRDLAKTYPYPFQWLALFPHLELSLEAPDPDDWRATARALLDSTQLRLPGALESALEAVAESTTEPADLRAKLTAALEEAKDAGYL
jgi:serine/threonine protein kinase